MALSIRPATFPRDATAFMDVWWDIYKGDPHWVPPLRFERKDFFNPAKNPYYKHALIQCFIAYQDGRAVGTISAQVDKNFQLREPGTGFFGFFEFPDDPTVSKALLEAARDWLAGQGMKKILGPFNFTSNHECGLLVDGFDGDPLVMMTYNPKYYLAHYERLGLTKAQDLYAYWLDAKNPIPENIKKLSDRFMSRHPNVKLRPVNLKDFENELKHLLAIYNDAWVDNWGSVKLDEEEMRKMIEGIKPMIDARFCYFAEVDGEVAAIAATLPDYNQVVKPMNGRLFPFGWWYWLTLPKKVDRLRVMILGVRKKFQHMPLGAPLYMKTWEEGLKAGVVGAEASWILEDNYRMRGALEKLGGKIYRTYRISGQDL